MLYHTCLGINQRISDKIYALQKGEGPIIHTSKLKKKKKVSI